MSNTIVHDDYTKRKPRLTQQTRRPKRPHKPPRQAPRRHWLDIGRDISLELTLQAPSGATKGGAE